MDCMDRYQVGFLLCAMAEITARADVLGRNIL